MAKKVKPTSMLDEQPAEQAIAQHISAPVISEEVNPLVGHNRMTTEQMEKLEKYDALEATVKQLNEANSMLEAKVTEYAEKISACSTGPQKVAELEAKVASLEKQLADAKASSSGDALLKKELKDLRAEADSYLVKISELTFENAKLECQLKSAANGRQPPPPAKRPSPPRKDPYNPYRNNGYASW